MNLKSLSHLLPPDGGNNVGGDTRLVFQAPAGFSIGV